MARHPRLRPRPTALLIAALLSLGAAGAWAGELDAPAAPSSKDSAMYTLEDIYKRLNANTQGSKRPGGFTEPTAGPGATGHTLDEIYAKAIPTQVPKTGQETCWNADGFSVTCTGTGQDGDLKKGVAWPSTRFTANVDKNNDGDCADVDEACDGTVTDNLTGLIWLKNAYCPQGTSNWATALSYVASLNSSGKMNNISCGDTSKNGSHQNDWRLPNINELQSLVDYGQFHPALPSGHPFSNVRSSSNLGHETYLSWYWTSSVYDSFSAGAVALADGGLWFTNRGGGSNKNEFLNVWPVRGGQ